MRKKNRQKEVKVSKRGKGEEKVRKIESSELSSGPGKESEGEASKGQKEGCETEKSIPKEKGDSREK